MTIPPQSQTQVAIAWCLLNTAHRNSTSLQTIRNHFYQDEPCDKTLHAIVTAVQELTHLAYPETIAQLQQYGQVNSAQLQQYSQVNSLLWEGRVGLVYGGATKIKPYVFDVPKLHEIRGASALLDNINLVDLPAFFEADQTSEARFLPCRNAGMEYCKKVRNWLRQENYGELIEALIPELIIYSTGGNILAFCPADVIDMLADAIEKRYTTETLTANSCAVGQPFKPLELCFGLLPDQISEGFWWLKQYQENASDELVQAYLKIKSDATPEQVKTAFENRKSFNELVSKLAILFNQRRAGNDLPGRSTTRRYPPMLENHPYLRRDHAARHIAVLPTDLPKSPWHSEVSARKRIIGQITKQEGARQDWYRTLEKRWKPNPKAESWVKRFEDYLCQPKHSALQPGYYGQNSPSRIFESQTVGEIGNASAPGKYIGYIYADGNNMGGYIQEIKTPEKYRQFSEDVSRITQEAVYEALAQHLTIHQLNYLNDSNSFRKNGDWIHPFEIITIGGDDVLLIVPGDRALQIAQTIGEVFERELANHPQYQVTSDRPAHAIHRYKPTPTHPSNSQLSMSTGVLITAEDTPIVYATDLTEQLLKSAKEKAKQLKKQGHYGGTIDFLVLKAVTMITSDIKEFRKQGLVKTYPNRRTHTGDRPKDLHLYAAPYTLHEIDGLLKLICDLKAIDFPRSQLYQIRSFLEKGKRTAILNYRYFRARLKADSQRTILEEWFEKSWCNAKENNGNIAPWMHVPNKKDPEKSYYETIWREMVDLYEFIPTSVEPKPADSSTLGKQEVTP
jgi:CRISPR-associated protein Cmr2